MKSLFEQNGGAYSVVGDYRLPNLTMPDEPEYHISIWGWRRLDYLKKHKRLLYINLLASGKLTEHLREIDAAARERWEIVLWQMAETQGVTEQIKAKNQMLWVGKMNNIHACADEIVMSEIIWN